MTDPKTLLALAGAPLHPAPLDAAALLLIDAQREYTDGALPLAGIDAAVAQTARLLELARRHGVPVVHVVHHGKPGGGLFDPAGAMAAIIPAVAPLEGEAVVSKALPNAFAGTGLDALLRATGRTELIVAGFMTHMCVSSTVRAALDLGWRSTVVASATATRDLPDVRGGVVPAAELQRAALAALADRFAMVVEGADAWG
ncbi:isochorismatase family protein [Azospirillum thermophilum]|uniref:Cysteine hydrolase n=1 Tax=Azospirillum thermophilum TaxID=2202148 RepID=A0A2S2CSB5_9PROT|nr:isochorismatase family protein [Azospirillum thermophilum]AWK87368.1 cysteine hydrolase [Azospirillum thermophilum]